MLLFLYSAENALHVRIIKRCIFSRWIDFKYKPRYTIVNNNVKSLPSRICIYSTNLSGTKGLTFTENLNFHMIFSFQVSSTKKIPSKSNPSLIEEILDHSSNGRRRWLVNSLLPLNFIYSEKVTKFCAIFTLLLTGTT